MVSFWKGVKNAGRILLAVLVIACILAGIIGMIMYQFSIYQKKHGEDMTFIDFLFDSERK